MRVRLNRITVFHHDDAAVKAIETFSHADRTSRSCDRPSLVFQGAPGYQSQRCLVAGCAAHRLFVLIHGLSASTAASCVSPHLVYRRILCLAAVRWPRPIAVTK